MPPEECAGLLFLSLLCVYFIDAPLAFRKEYSSLAKWDFTGSQLTPICEPKPNS